MSSPRATTIHKVCSEARSKQRAESIDTDGDPSVEIVEGPRSADVSVDPAVRLLPKLILCTIRTDGCCHGRSVESISA